MGIEEQIDRLIDLGEDIKSRLDLLVELASDHFAGADKMVADEPPKKWRIREPGEEVQEGDLMNEKSNLPSDPPDGDGWIDASICVGSEVAASDECIFACPVADEPAKEPPEPEYREPVLPADAGKLCEFSDDGKTWRSGYLKGFDYDEHRHQGEGWRRNQTCSSDRARHRFARIKKEA